MRMRKTEAPTGPTTRLEALADGVLAIAMTLLVIEIQVPEVAKTLSDAELTTNIVEMWPRFLIYGLSFLILGIFWLYHNLIFQMIKRSNSTLVWLNILFLMFVALIPFSTSLFGEYGAAQISALFYGINMLLLFDTSWAILHYATRGQRLVDGDIDPAMVKGANTMGLIYTLIMVPAIAISFINRTVSFLVSGLMVAVIIGSTLFGRTEFVTVFPRSTMRGSSGGRR